MHDYTWQSVYFAYFFFALTAGGALFFFFRSLKDGYFGRDSEDPKYRMLQDDADDTQSTGAVAPRRTR